ncbi:hypothetical protein NUW58_g2143 [Xylaria curta]|uniref:Uncharacterized protein n=1 Tax=Xylaria curta TaxID=42375 RepID=A0ACC1PIQ7_9PEZI|nr:hypothetical protein NUW58_g2143 [Xylaria curta]
MSNAGLYVSFGECFYGEGQISDPRFIPCGNAAVGGTQACCFQGDFCLSANVCYDNDTSVTYIAGCTDATYSSSKCPHKAGYPDQQWVALARCDGSDIDLFSGCGHHKNQIWAAYSEPDRAAPNNGRRDNFVQSDALPTATASSSDSNSGGLSTGAKAGIGVGVGVGVLAS